MLRFKADPPPAKVSVNRSLAYRLALALTQWPSYQFAPISLVTFWSPTLSKLYQVNIGEKIGYCATYYDNFYCLAPYIASQEAKLKYVTLSSDDVNDPFKAEVVFEYDTPLDMPACTQWYYKTWHFVIDFPTGNVTFAGKCGIADLLIYGIPSTAYWNNGEKWGFILPLDGFYGQVPCSLRDPSCVGWDDIIRGRVTWTSLTDQVLGGINSIVVQGTAEITEWLFWGKDVLTRRRGVGPSFNRSIEYFREPIFAEEMDVIVHPQDYSYKPRQAIIIPYDFK